VPEEILVVFVTARDAGEAERLGEGAVGARLAACANLLGPVRSIYRWKGELRRDGEHLLLLKTTRSCFERLAEFLRERHSYDVPEIVAVPVSAGSEPYLRWVAEETATGTAP
jgi:periplasmic divalent cation tolerance protein